MPVRRTSAELKALRGTLRPDRRPKVDCAAALAVAPGAPRGLTKAAKAEWGRLAEALVAMRVLTAADLRALELLTETLATERCARDVLAAEGMTVPTADGGLKPHPAVRTLETARTQALRLLDAFGLTPRGRRSIDAPPPHDEADEFERFLASGDA